MFQAFHIGGFLHKPPSAEVAIQVELLYSEKGGKGRQSTGDNAIQFRYLSLPVLLNLQLVDDLVLEVTTLGNEAFPVSISYSLTN